MKKTSFRYLEKQNKLEILPDLFDIFYENTNSVAPFSRSYEIEREGWLSEVSPALEKEPRQIILIYHRDMLAGFVMYYTRGELLMIEELQLKDAYQGTLLLYKTVEFFAKMLGDKISSIEAYALKKNKRSIALMRGIGFSEIQDTLGSRFLHFGIDAKIILSRIRKNMDKRK